MFHLIDAAHALGGPPAEGGRSSGIFGFLPFILMFVVLYLLILRPQLKKQKDQKRMIDELQKGDQIVTSGGIHGVITHLKDEVITVKIADTVRIEVSRAAVSRVKNKEGGGK